MRHIRTNVAGLIVATALTSFGAAALGQTVQTPYSPGEAGPALSPAEEAAGFGAGGVPCVTPYSPNECGPAEMPGRGGTLAPEMGGAVRMEGGSFGGLVITPDSDLNVNRIDD